MSYTPESKYGYTPLVPIQFESVQTLTSSNPTDPERVGWTVDATRHHTKDDILIVATAPGYTNAGAGTDQGGLPQWTDIGITGTFTRLRIFQPITPGHTRGSNGLIMARYHDNNKVITLWSGRPETDWIGGVRATDGKYVKYNLGSNDLFEDDNPVWVRPANVATRNATVEWYGSRAFLGEWKTSVSGTNNQGVMRVVDYDGDAYSYGNSYTYAAADVDGNFGRNARVRETATNQLNYFFCSSTMGTGGGWSIWQSVNGGVSWVERETVNLTGGLAHSGDLSPDSRRVVVHPASASNDDFRVYLSDDNWGSRSAFTVKLSNAGASFSQVQPGCIRWITDDHFLAIGTNNHIAVFYCSDTGINLQDEWHGLPAWGTPTEHPGIGEGEGQTIKILPDEKLIVIGHWRYTENGTANAGAVHVITYSGG